MSYELLYTTNKDFNTYVNKYMEKHNLSMDEVLTHVLVQFVGCYYYEKDKDKVTYSDPHMV